MSIRLLAWLLLCTLLPGVYFDHPLTGWTVQKISTAGYSGVWESTDSKGRTYRARVVPITGDRYYVSFRPAGRKKAPTGRSGILRAWISRVSYSRFLSLKCSLTSGEIPGGGLRLRQLSGDRSEYSRLPTSPTRLSTRSDQSANSRRGAPTLEGEFADARGGTEMEKDF